MPRAFLIKKHSTTKRKINVVDEDFSVHEPRDYSKKDSVASDSGNESCSPANSPSPQPYSYYRHPFHPDDIPPPPPAATALIARSSLDIYGRPTVLEPLNLNASLSNLSGWMKPYLPSYLQFGCSPFHHGQHGLTYGFPSSEPFLAQRSISPLTPTEEPSATDGSKCLDLTSNTLLRKPTPVNKRLEEDDESSKEPAGIGGAKHWTELPQDMKMYDAETYRKKPCSTGGGRRRAADGPRYNCPDCNKSYSTYSGLSKHQQFHCSTNNKRTFSCKYCEKVYVSLGALKMHIRTHTLPCKCKLCGKAFSRPWLLQGHIRTHTGEKPFTCPHCNRAFADRSNLRAHLQTHSDVKKYSCKTCAKTFSRMSLLLKHEDGGCGQCGGNTFTATSPVQDRLGP